MVSRPLRVGLVAWHALPAIVPTDDSGGLAGGRSPGKPKYGESFGGLETAIWTLARHMAKLPGIEPVCFVEATAARNGSQPWPKEVDGVRLAIHVQRFKAIRHEVGECVDFGAKRIKRFSPKLLWQLPLLMATRPFRSRDPVDSLPDPRLFDQAVDAWIAFGVTASSSRVVATADRERTPCFVCIRSNAGLEDGLLGDDEYKNECGDTASARRYALLQADHVVCQSQWQLDRLREVFHRDGLLARNPIDCREWRPPWKVDVPESLAAPFDVLWVGRYDDFHKQPKLMLEAAKKLPHRSIKMIVNPFDPRVEAEVRQSVPSNVELIDRVPFEQMPAVFGAARTFVSTGSLRHEGFPNVLLQAAASHTPIVSLSDHDQFLQRSGAGVTSSESLDDLPRLIEQQITEPTVSWSRVDDYLQQFHQADAIASQFAVWIQTAIESKRTPG
ncbi:glycosyltransferase family 4 protein [Rhodopirellula halodulae]|uniref:glycosyltransferase family 4 protein n=1 Tax=Rhodopirellula halodulae TaxID=2894198 RepID=UPI001E64DCCD|nr:glycosyltransferase family 4 protein [Rhodopirellula sp. JC737]MCC9654236.1 glycosyltransferase family 4 protein [Rhodopirellula sp. JC737]